ncbi:MAG TPA: PIG-L family deacetylase [Acidimicrobiales bacterium]|nr:PIG-L family deacetylase [Acidimicrobiales bacterium]
MSSVSEARPAAEVAAGLGTVLGVWAHPDDEAYLSGGLMAAAVDAGARVVCVTATRGERGTPDPERWPPERLAPVRDGELAASLAVLGVTDHRHLGYPDGACDRVPPGAAVARLRELIAEVRPDTVLTFGPDGMTGHPDHRTVSAWTTSAVRGSDLGGAPRLLYASHSASWCDRFDALHRALDLFPPGLPVPVGNAEVAVELVLPDDLLDRKLAALRAHASQVEPLIALLGEAAFRAWVADECFRSA